MCSIIPSTPDQSYEFLHQSQIDAPVTSGNAAPAKRFNDQSSQRQARTLQRLYHEAGSWAQLASELGLNRGLLWKVAHGQIRHSPKVGRALRRRFWQRLVRWFRAIPTGGAR